MRGLRGVWWTMMVLVGLMAGGAPLAERTAVPEAGQSVQAGPALPVATARPGAASDVSVAAARARDVAAERARDVAKRGAWGVALLQTEGCVLEGVVAPWDGRAAAGARWRVGVQVGHWRLDELPDELAQMGASQASYGELSEAELNLSVAREVQAILQEQGVEADLLPATVPPGYQADAFVSIHADEHPNSERRGWKLAAPWRASRASQDLEAAVASTYGGFTGIPQDLTGATLDMQGYYAFNFLRFRHAIAPTTPAVIVEMGYMTSPDDRAALLRHPRLAADGIAQGVLRYLLGRDPSDLDARCPQAMPLLRAAAPDLALRREPATSAQPLLRLMPAAPLIPLVRHDDWYMVALGGTWAEIGWVREDQVEALRASQ